MNDYPIHVFEIAYLSEEQVQQFQSDFRIVADYFVQMRKNKNYIPSQDTIHHVREVMELMSVLTDDTRFEEMIEVEGRTTTNMCEALNQAEEKGRREGKIEGKVEERMQSIHNLLETTGWSLEQVLQMLKIPDEERETIKTMVMI